jgi:hypothetical protein
MRTPWYRRVSFLPASPERYVDTGDMKLSDVDVKLHLLAERGRIGGEIAMKSICHAIPMFDYLLLEEKVRGDTATITAFDSIGGERKNFFRFTAKRDHLIITVSLKEGRKSGSRPLQESDSIPTVRVRIHTIN